MLMQPETGAWGRRGGGGGGGGEGERDREEGRKEE